MGEGVPGASGGVPAPSGALGTTASGGGVVVFAAVSSGTPGCWEGFPDNAPRCDSLSSVGASGVWPSSSLASLPMVSMAVKGGNGKR